MTNTPSVSPEQWQLAFDADRNLHCDLLFAQVAARDSGIKTLPKAIEQLNTCGFAVVARQSDGVAVVDLLHAGGASLEFKGSSPTTIISGILAITTAQPANSEEAA